MHKRYKNKNNCTKFLDLTFRMKKILLSKHYMAWYLYFQRVSFVILHSEYIPSELSLWKEHFDVNKYNFPTVLYRYLLLFNLRVIDIITQININLEQFQNISNTII